MSAGSPAIVVPTLLVDGQVLDPTVAVIAIDIRKEANRIPAARLDIAARGQVLDQPAMLTGAPFAPGAEVEIKFRPADADITAFKGVVVELGIRLGRDGTLLGVELRDKAIALTRTRRSKLFTEATDSDAIAAILDEAGLDAGDLPATEPTHPALVQANATDWDFIVSRAEAQGLIVVVNDGVVSLKAMALEAASVVIPETGGGIEAVEFAFDLSHQHPGITAVAWNADELAAAEPTEAENLAIPQGGVGSAAAGAELGAGPFALTHMVPMPPPEVQRWADARMARSRLALIRGRIAATAMIEAKPMQVASIAGLGDRFNGDALITGVRYRLDGSGFRTDLQFGLAPEPFCRQPDILDVPAGGLLPAALGLQLAVVADIEDPQSLMRVKVRIPALGAEGEIWARVTAADAGDQRGIVFRPEVGDEVLVAFLGDDPRYPVVIGRLFGSVNVPPDDLADNSADNIAKGIVTRSGASLLFADNDNPSITLKTPAGNELKLDDDGKTLTLTDQNGNTIALNEDGISLTSAKDFTIEASGKVTITGQEVAIN